ncbi:hypothetical protein [Dysgonomonas sp. Marseille-P4361]|uniref:hypothetical protein n=1 Tax=Dysgonomonas sp. Marseille-P4361 TaxID=2161820 RepID=UPI000D55ED15|nr:hypothetical protein [Dysgonomonas sp. Marseille-P4361]
MNYLKTFLLTISLLLSVFVTAQVTMGSLEEPNKGALLDLTQGLSEIKGVNSSKGLLLPRVELYHLQRLKMGEFEITDPDEKLKHTGLTVYHIPPTTKSSEQTKSTPIADSDLSQRQDIPAGVYYWDGEKWGRYGGEAEKPVIELIVTPQLITFGAYETDVRYYTVKVTDGARWTMTVINDPEWKVVASEQNGTIAINPVAPNGSLTSDKTIDVNVYASMPGAETVSAKVSAIQKTADFTFGISPLSQTYEGNKKETFKFIVATSSSAVEWTLDTHPHWDISQTSGSGEGSYAIYITPKELNTSGEDIVTTLTARGRLENVEREVTITLTHKAAPVDYTADLSLPNCYIVTPDQTQFSFPIAKAVAVWKQGVWQGLNKDEVKSALIPTANAQNVDNIETLNAKVLWYDNANVLNTSSVKYNAEKQEIEFTRSSTGSTTKGNAVIALYDKENGNVLWSWHIWVTDQPKEERFTQQNNLVWLDRNLGATETTTTTNGNSYKHKGLLYQWGRKDPFPGSSNTVPGSTNSSRVPISIWSGSSYPSMSQTYPTKAATDFGKGDDQDAQRLIYSIQNPITYLTNASGSDWYALPQGTLSYKMNVWTDRWAGERVNRSNTNLPAKAAMDPCPDGWRVPYPVAETLIGLGTIISPWGTFSGAKPVGATSGYAKALTYGSPKAAYGFEYSDMNSINSYYSHTGQLSKEDGKIEYSANGGSGNITVDNNTGTYWSAYGRSLSLPIVGRSTIFGETMTIGPVESINTAGELILGTHTHAETGLEGGTYEDTASGAAVRCVKDLYNYNK